MSSTKAELLLAAARYLNETLELQRVYERFHELLAEAVPHNGVIVSSFEPETGLISADYAWVDGDRLDPTILPPLPLNREGGGMEFLTSRDIPNKPHNPRLIEIKRVWAVPRSLAATDGITIVFSSSRY